MTGVLKRPVLKPTHARDSTPLPVRKKPLFDRPDGTVNVTAVPPIKWDVTDPAEQAARPASRSASRSPSGGKKGKGRKRAGEKGRKGKGRGKDKKGRGKGKR